MPQLENFTVAKPKRIKEGEEPYVHHVIISRTKRYDAMIAYGGHGGAEMLKAAEFKRKRLLEKDPDSVIPAPKIFRSQQEFKDIWTSIFNDLQLRNKSGMYTYELYEIHIIAHSNSDFIIIKEGEHITEEVVKTLEKLRWHPQNGYLVLHSCRSGRFEDDDIIERDSKECIARSFSKFHETNVIGQMVFASYNSIIHSSEIRYREMANDYVEVDILGSKNLVLWGYKSGNKIKKHYSKQEEFSALNDGQIWPCRKFRNGEEYNRHVAPEKFNFDDLTFI